MKNELTLEDIDASLINDLQVFIELLEQESIETKERIILKLIILKQLIKIKDAIETILAMKDKQVIKE